MDASPPDLERRRRRQRRRALIGWIGGALGVAAIVATLIVGGGSDGRRSVDVPYGEVMTSAQYEAIHGGEEDAEVLGRLDKSGRPERLTEPYVLQLFPPPGEDVYCTYWEFTDEPEIFARLCFSRSNGELVNKERHSLFQPPPAVGGHIV